MSFLALMRWLEATPERYDSGMQAITLGRVAQLHEAVAREAVPKPGCDVLEIGCGTGAVTERLVRRGAHVTALDQSAQMLEQAKLRLMSAGNAEIDWLEQTASEIDALPRAAFDSVVLSLCLSDMSTSERHYVLSQSRERLRPGGRLIVADEVRLRGATRVLQSLIRAPQWLAGWLLAGSVSHPLKNLRAELEASGFEVRHEQQWLAGTLALFIGEPGK